LASQYGISFMDISKLWALHHPTVFTVLASDVDSLKYLSEDEACRRVMDVLHDYVRFDDRDVDWSYSHYQAHPGQPLFVNDVGSWEYRPEVRLTDSYHQSLDGQIWRKVRNLYLAGDYC